MLGIVPRIPPSVYMEIRIPKALSGQLLQLRGALFEGTEIRNKHGFRILNTVKPAVLLDFLPDTGVDDRRSHQGLHARVPSNLLLKRGQPPILSEPCPVVFAKRHIVAVRQEFEPEAPRIGKTAQTRVPLHLHASRPMCGMTKQEARVPRRIGDRHIPGAVTQLAPPRHIRAARVNKFGFQLPVLVEVKFLRPAVRDERALHQRVHGDILAVPAFEVKRRRPDDSDKLSRRFPDRTHVRV